MSQRLAERSAIPEAKTAGADRRRRAQNAGFYRASALAGMPNGQLRKNKKNDIIFMDFEQYFLNEVYCQFFRALSQRLSERSAIPQAQKEGPIAGDEHRMLISTERAH